MKIFKYKNTCVFTIIVLILIIISTMFFYYKEFNRPTTTEDDERELKPDDDKEKIIINDIDGNNTNYEFTYNDETFKAIYAIDNWKIYNSYKIKNINDIKEICQALINIHPIHGKDMISYRTADDMVYEWLQHNIMYEVLPEDNEWKDNAKDVDFDPKDQGKSIKEIYENRTGKNLDFDLSDR